MDVLFNISVFRVDEIDFRSCDLKRGSLVTKGSQSSQFAVAEEYLKTGNNYFIGFYGNTCDKQVANICDVNPCENNATCVGSDNNYTCICAPGYTGYHCEIDLCNPSPCQNATECIDLGHDFQCTCRPGFSGAHCEINVNECESNPCRNGGICRDTTAGYRCLCPEGISGIHCEYKRLDLPRLPTHDSVYHDPATSHIHINNLYIVAGTLAGALLIALSVLAGCYCKVHETYRIFFMKTSGYSRQHNSLRQKREYSARQVARQVEEPRPSIDAILEATSIGFEDNSLNAPLVNSLKPKRV
ncbi:hypothetical protein LSH36_460g02011 [Paralvinella palmiformis]|uniref:EGF-like domain-containing protein n=1 Tax=Paralvinella palmiformis TaxID=53620 RepID=A0AAD9JB58_9ANNE|nr:hypothetical protein LSH36_460g02011 [Paralvinella palmiformis]